jgi:hypothetical protein
MLIQSLLISRRINLLRFCCIRSYIDYKLISLVDIIVVNGVTLLILLCICLLHIRLYLRLFLLNLWNLLPRWWHLRLLSWHILGILNCVVVNTQLVLPPIVALLILKQQETWVSLVIQMINASHIAEIDTLRLNARSVWLRGACMGKVDGTGKDAILFESWRFQVRFGIHIHFS